jgi:uncharacterized protein YkwD
MPVERKRGVVAAGLAVVGAFLLAFTGVVASGHRADALTNCTVSDYSLDGEEQAFLGLINAYRQQNGLGTLTISTNLNRDASWMVIDLATNNYFSHTDSLGRSAYQRGIDCGYPQGAGENLAAGGAWSSAQAAFDAWKASPGHNANMLGSYYQQIGIARFYSASATYGWYWATEFGATNDGTGGGGGAPTNTPVPTNTPANTATPAPTNTPGASPTATNTPPATATPTSTPTSAPTPTPSGGASGGGGGASPTAGLPTSTPTPKPATPTPGGSPTATNTPGTPTSTPTQAPTATPTTPPASPAASLPLSPGANLVAWPSADMAPADAIAGSGSTIAVIYQYDAATGQWKRYFPGLPGFLNNLTMMRRGQAYWIIATTGSRLRIAED